MECGHACWLSKRLKTGRNSSRSRDKSRIEANTTIDDYHFITSIFSRSGGVGSATCQKHPCNLWFYKDQTRFACLASPASDFGTLSHTLSQSFCDLHLAFCGRDNLNAE